MPEDQKADALAELEEPEYQLCPDTVTYTLSGSTRSSDRKGLKFKVDPKAGYDYTPGTGKDEDRINDTNVYSSMINRYFTPDLYNEQGYMTFIAVTEAMFSCKTQE